MLIKDFFSSKKGKITILSLIIIVFAFGLTYYFMYGSALAKYKSSIKEVISYIDKGNNEAISTYNHMNDPKNLPKVKNSIKNSEKNLTTAIKIMKATTPPAEFKQTHENFLNGINSNKILFTQSISILDNYVADTIADSINTLYGHLSTTSSYYEKTKIDNLGITLSNNFLKFPEKISEYTNIINETVDNSAPNYDMQLSYVNDIKLQLESLENLEAEINQNINSSKTGKLSSKQLIISLSSTKNKLSSITENTNNITSLSEINDIKTGLLATLKSYENYLVAFRTSIETSKEQETSLIILSSIKSSESVLSEYETKKTELKNLIKEKEDFYLQKQ